jgi:hypothetical protein
VRGHSGQFLIPPAGPYVRGQPAARARVSAGSRPATDRGPRRAIVECRGGLR